MVVFCHFLWHHGTRRFCDLAPELYVRNRGAPGDRALVAFVPCRLVCVRHNEIVNGLHCKEKFGGKEKEGDAKATGGQSSSSVAVLLRACAFASGIAKF